MKIETEEEYIKACEDLRFLIGTTWQPGNAAVSAIKELTADIDEYDKIHHKTPDLDPIELLKYLMKNQNMSNKDLGELLGITNMRFIEDILNYKYKLPDYAISVLCDHFKVIREAFDRDYTLIKDDYPEILIGNPNGNEEWSKEKINKLKAFAEERVAKRTPEQKLEMELLGVKYSIKELIDDYENRLVKIKLNLSTRKSNKDRFWYKAWDRSLESTINDLKKIFNNICILK